MASRVTTVRHTNNAFTSDFFLEKCARLSGVITIAEVIGTESDLGNASSRSERRVGIVRVRLSIQ